MKSLHLYTCRHPFYNYSPMAELDNFSCEPTDEMEDEAARGPATEHGAKLHIIFRVNINNIDFDGSKFIDLFKMRHCFVH